MRSGVPDMQGRSLYSTFSSLLLFLLCIQSAHSQYFLNSSFETPALAAGAYQYAPTGANWTFTAGNAGISTATSAFASSSPEIPLGKQVAFLQNTGCMSQSVNILKNAILTFSATQRVNLNSQLQSLSVYVGPTQQPITAGSPSGAYTTYSITPPRDYYATYGVELPSVTANGTYNIKICGLNTTGDATALLDTVTISTIVSPYYGLWDTNGVSGSWRTDYLDASTGPTLGTCYFATGSNSAYGYSGPFCKPLGTVSPTNWNSSNSTVAGPVETPYVPGTPHWIVMTNVENYNETTCSFGPPDQSQPLQARGATSGARFDILDDSAGTYPTLGTGKIYQLIWQPYSALTNDCIPYMAFGANSKHGNGKPVAVMDKAGHYRPRVSFNESVFQATGFGYAYVAFHIGGFDDNIDRALVLVLGEEGTSGPTDVANEFWNWPIKNSKYYPGQRAAYIEAATAQARCGISSTDLPVLSYTNQWIPSGQSASAISHYNFDLYTLVNCVAQEMVNQNGINVTGWAGGANQLPDPIVINNIEWSIETLAGPANPDLDWVGVWNMKVQ